MFPVENKVRHQAGRGIRGGGWVWRAEAVPDVWQAHVCASVLGLL